MTAGRTVAAYGAAAKGATLLNSTGIGTDLVAYVVDRNVHKQGKLMPGCRLPIRPVEVLLDERPDDLLLLAWNFAAEIVAAAARVRGDRRTLLRAGPDAPPHRAVATEAVASRCHVRSNSGSRSTLVQRRRRRRRGGDRIGGRIGQSSPSVGSSHAIDRSAPASYGRECR